MKWLNDHRAAIAEYVSILGLCTLLMFGCKKLEDLAVKHSTKKIQTVKRGR